MDEGVNFEIVYIIIFGNLEVVFDINYLIGEVFFIKLFDFEKTIKYFFNIIVDDRGNLF